MQFGLACAETILIGLDQSAEVLSAQAWVLGASMVLAVYTNLKVISALTSKLLLCTVCLPSVCVCPPDISHGMVC